jgi:hypothetical protein
VVGYGSDPPQRVHHRAASCPNPPAVCDYRYFSLQSPNPRTVSGALVGGPDPSDIYRDDRTDAQSNEVAIDYNSGFTGGCFVKLCLLAVKSLETAASVMWCDGGWACLHGMQTVSSAGTSNSGSLEVIWT